MTYVHPGRNALDYYPCRYGSSKLQFRGPYKSPTGRYCTAFGGSETYGKFVAEPWPTLLEGRLGLPVLNFGYLNAGVDVFLNDPQITTIAAKARLSVVQLLAPHNMNNRFYAVHPRRNDRFLRASAGMQALFHEVDFTEFNFTGHMLAALATRCPDRFAAMAAELKAAWVARTRNLLERIGGRVLLLWVRPQGDTSLVDPVPLGHDIVAAVSPLALETVVVDPSAAAWGAGLAGMQFDPLEEPAAAEMPGPMVHAEIAEALAPHMLRLL